MRWKEAYERAEEQLLEHERLCTQKRAKGQGKGGTEGELDVPFTAPTGNLLRTIRALVHRRCLGTDRVQVKRLKTSRR